MSSEVLPGFVPPPYPYDRLEPIANIANSHLGGIVDLSVGTPIDAPIDEVTSALSASGLERGYPASLGSIRLRDAVQGWLRRRFNVELLTSQLAVCVGTKEFVATTPWYLRLRSPSKDTVLYPEVSYPTYALGAQLGQCRAVAVPLRSDGSLDLSSIQGSDISRALMLWSNSPSNPTGKLDDLEALYKFANETGVPVFSDECYTEFTWSKSPDSILKYGLSNIISVHSLSKRSNLAGIRLGFYAGDQGLVDYLSLVRKHAGMMVPGPIQFAGAIAFDDDCHVEAQRVTYKERLEFMVGVFSDLGYQVSLPDGGFYLWFRSHFNDGFDLATELAKKLGILVSPGEFFGETSKPFVRVAMVAEMEKLELIAKRAKEKDDS